VVVVVIVIVVVVLVVVVVVLVVRTTQICLWREGRKERIAFAPPPPLECF